jgi:hypothetical protein
VKARSLSAALIVFALGLVVGRAIPADRLARGPEPGPSGGGTPPGMVLVPAASLAPLPEGVGPEEKRDVEVFRRARNSVKASLIAVDER